MVKYLILSTVKHKNLQVKIISNYIQVFLFAVAEKLKVPSEHRKLSSEGSRMTVSIIKFLNVFKNFFFAFKETDNIIYVDCSRAVLIKP